MKLLIISLLAILSGCAANSDNHTLVVLQNPTTKATVECKGDAWTTWNVYAQVESCAQAYEKAGFVRLGHY